MIDKTLAQRDRQVTQKYYEILDYIYDKEDWPKVKLKQVQQLAGYLNYYLAFAGRMYKLETFFLHNFRDWEKHKEWWDYLVRIIMPYNIIHLNKFA